MEKILGLINFENGLQNMAGLTQYRSLSALPMFGRYRVIDFPISNFTNSRIDDIYVFVKSKPRSIIEHVTKTPYPINSKDGDLKIMPCLENTPDYYNTDVANFNYYKSFIEENDANYVVLAPSNYVFISDFRELVEKHKANKADISILYYKTYHGKDKNLLCNALQLVENSDVVQNLYLNKGIKSNSCISLDTYVMRKDIFLELIEKAKELSAIANFFDVVNDNINKLSVKGIRHDAKAWCINSLKAYYDVNIEFLNAKVHKTIINEDWPIYSRTSDSCPCLLGKDSNVSNSVVANGSQVFGTVKNSVIGRNTIIQKGAIVENAVILDNCFINKNIVVKNAVIDRKVIINHKKEIEGTNLNPAYVKRGDKI